MCGLTGFLQPPGDSEDVLCRTVTRMAETLVHRGPDDSGAWADPSAGIALGFRRLAIIDLSPAGHQPMLSADGRFVIIFNGEVYNFRELRAELETRGRRFRGGSDTEVILEGCSEWGVELTLRRLIGMFAIALWDRAERALVLARDRLGKKPMYYGSLGGAFLFGSELKALRAHPAFRGEIDRDALAIYLRYGYIPAPHCIYRGLRKLPPAHYAVIRAGAPPELRCYWNAREIVQAGLAHPLALADEDAADELDRLLRDAVARRMIADVPLGAFLSGGVDSSTVVALMQAQSARPVKTFSIGFHIPEYDEAAYARDVARHLGTEHTELYVTPEEAQAVIPRLPDLYDEPFGDSSQIPTFLISQLARRHVTVALSGDGGDELFGGYTRYLWANAIWARARHLPQPLRRAMAATVHRTSHARLDALYGRIEAWLPAHWRQSAPGDKLHKLMSVLPAPDAGGLYHHLVSQWKAPHAVVIGGTEPATPLSDASLPRLFPDFTDRMMYLDLITYLPGDILTKVDRASMGVSLEARAPLLDHRVVEWAWRLPGRLKNRDGQSKWLLRQVLYRYVPPSLIERPKIGFGVPIDHWLRSALRDWAEGLISAPRLEREGFFNPAPIRKAWADHLGGHGNEDHRLWAVFMFQAWKERWG